MPSAKASLKAMAKEAKGKDKSATSKKTIQPVPAVSFKSTEYIQESDDEDEEEDENEKSNNESNSDEDSLPEHPAQNTTKANGKLPAPSGSSSSSEDESSSNENSDEDEEEQNESHRKPDAQPEPARHHKGPSTRTVAFEKPPPFKPPPGFEAAPIGENSTASQLLKKSNLIGKQVWYFTAPASIPISIIEQLSMSDVEAGKAVLNHAGGNYGFVQDTTSGHTYTSIMVSSSSDDAYLTASKPIDRTLHLQQIVTLPGINDAGVSVPSYSKATVPAKKPVRQQPKGLKMRFRPIGFGKGEIGNIGTTSSSDDESASDEEIEDAPTVFRRHDIDETERPGPAKSKDEDSSSDSDGEMEAAILPPKLKTKSTSSTKTAEATSSPLKRKHSGEDKSAKKKKTERISQKHIRQSISVN